MTKPGRLGKEALRQLLQSRIELVVPPLLFQQAVVVPPLDDLPLLQDHDPRGEYVLVVAGAAPREEAAVTLEEGAAQVLALVEAGQRLKDAVREVAEHTGLSKNGLYATALEMRD